MDSPANGVEHTPRRKLFLFPKGKLILSAAALLSSAFLVQSFAVSLQYA